LCFFAVTVSVPRFIPPFRIPALSQSLLLEP
jgi:hypothetical protein